ncbi:MAG: hypothetical protein DRN20_05405 [Thermoplasmata archaeon]|nr:MAG: hypothetical protein DRN20_05405 [Thermoplasmata archaeon]
MLFDFINNFISICNDVANSLYRGLQSYCKHGGILDNYLSFRDERRIKHSVICLDEITFVHEWWRAIKSRIDLGKFENDVLILTGSASMEIMKQRELFPGRRGYGRDFLMLPLSFNSYAKVLGKLDIVSGGIEDVERTAKANKIYSDKLSDLFKKYMETGGFPRSIKDYWKYGKVSIETERIYLDWVRGDWVKAGRSEKYMKEVLSYIIRARGTPISWLGIAAETSLSSPNTARVYVETLEHTFVAKTLNFISPDFRVMHRKNKKIHITDPFLIKIISRYTRTDFSKEWAVEATVASHIARICPVYYWRNSTEVDIVCIVDNKQIGIEVTTGIKRRKRPKHMKEFYVFDGENIPVYLAGIG